VVANADIIEIEFTAPILESSVKDGETFIVVSTSGNVPHPGNTTVKSNLVRWVGKDGFRFLRDHVYTVTLVSNDQSAITSIGGSRLDGEPHQKLPSGDDHEGGDFVFMLMGI
jgi:hypothetical protein